MPATWILQIFVCKTLISQFYSFAGCVGLFVFVIKTVHICTLARFVLPVPAQ